MKKRLLLTLVVLVGLFLLCTSIVCAQGMGDQYHNPDHNQYHDPDHDQDHDRDQDHDQNHHQHHTDLEDYDLCIWDCSGTYTDSRDNMTLNCTLIQDAKGKVTGHGTFDYLSDENDISIDVEIKGKVKGKNNIVTLKYKVKGKDADGNKLKDKVLLELDKNSLSLVGTMKRKLCVSGECVKLDNQDVSHDVPDGMTGEAMLSIDAMLNEKSKKLEGTGELTLSNGDIYNLSAKGKYNSNQNETQFQLKGADGPAKEIKLKLKINEESDAATFIRGKAHNQNLKHK